MCVISMVGDQYTEKFKNWPGFASPPLPGQTTHTILTAGVSQADFDKLKAEVVEMKAALIKAKLLDEASGQKDCHMEEKVALLRKVAEAVGINLDDVLPALKAQTDNKDD